MLPRALHIAKTLGKRPHLVILPGRIGDIVAADPALDLIRKENDFTIWLCQESYANLLKFHPDIDLVLPVSSLTEALILRRLAPNQKWSNLAIDGWLCNKFGIKCRNPNAQGVDFTNYYSHGTLSDVFSLIAAGRIASRYPRVYLGDDFDIDAWLAAVFKSSSRPLIVVHLSSDEHARTWSEKEAVHLRNWLSERERFNVIELGKSPLMPIGTYIVRAGTELPLTAQMEIIRHAVLFIGVDSGFAHVANALAIPSVLLLGRYRNFDSYLPVRLRKTDIVVRSAAQAFTIEARQVIDVLESYESAHFDMG